MPDKYNCCFGLLDKRLVDLNNEHHNWLKNTESHLMDQTRVMIIHGHRSTNESLDSKNTSAGCILTCRKVVISLRIKLAAKYWKCNVLLWIKLHLLSTFFVSLIQVWQATLRIQMKICWLHVLLGQDDIERCWLRQEKTRIVRDMSACQLGI